MKQIYKATIKRSGKIKDLYFGNKDIAEKLLNHLENCKTCTKSKCPFYRCELLDSKVITLFDSHANVEKVAMDLIKKMDPTKDPEKTVEEILDKILDAMLENFDPEKTAGSSAKDIFNNHYFGKKFEA